MKIEDTFREPENMRKAQKLIVQRTMLYLTHPDFILSDFIQEKWTKITGHPPSVCQIDWFLK